jgi:hypothetical protein
MTRLMAVLCGAMMWASLGCDDVETPKMDAAPSGDGAIVPPKMDTAPLVDTGPAADGPKDAAVDPCVGFVCAAGQQCSTFLGAPPHCEACGGLNEICCNGAPATSCRVGTCTQEILGPITGSCRVPQPDASGSPDSGADAGAQDGGDGGTGS